MQGLDVGFDRATAGNLTQVRWPSKAVDHRHRQDTTALEGHRTKKGLRLKQLYQHARYAENRDTRL